MTQTGEDRVAESVRRLAQECADKTGEVWLLLPGPEPYTVRLSTASSQQKKVGKRVKPSKGKAKREEIEQ